MSHTPGPWTVTDNPNCGDGLNILDTKNRRVAHTSAVRNIKGKVLKEPIETEETAANARLIAAAPALLAALQECASRWVSGADVMANSKTADNARAAIAKAKGD